MAAKRAGSVSNSVSAIAAVLMSLVAVGVTTSTQSISLANFTPRIENLPVTCQNVYETAIDGCNKDDFTSSAGCSSKCVQGLLKISKLVASGCRGVDVPETSIIGVFNLGKGVQALCPGVEVTTISSRPSSTAPVFASSTTSQTLIISSSTTTAAAASSSSFSSVSSSSSSVQSTSSSASSASSASTTSSQQQQQQQTPSPSSATTSILAVDSSTSLPPATATNGNQQANQNAGVGSPFDIGITAGSSSSSTTTIKPSLAMLSMLIMSFMLGAGTIM